MDSADFVNSEYPCAVKTEPLVQQPSSTLATSSVVDVKPSMSSTIDVKPYFDSIVFSEPSAYAIGSQSAFAMNANVASGVAVPQTATGSMFSATSISTDEKPMMIGGIDVSCLPPVQRELYLRIQQQQKTNVVSEEPASAASAAGE